MCAFAMSRPQRGGFILPCSHVILFAPCVSLWGLYLVVFSTDLLENLLRQMADDLKPHLCVLFRKLGTVNIVCDSKNLALCTFEYSVNMIAVSVAYTTVLTLLWTRALFLL